MAPLLPALSAVRRTTTTLVASALTLGLAAGGAFADTGVDVSSWQHGTSLNWAKVRATGVDFAFIKATEGATYTNPWLAGDWAATKANGIYHGAYHFARPSRGSAAAQARFFVAKAGLANRAGDLPPVLDLEATGNLGVSALQTWTRTWLTTVQTLTGRTPMIYCSPAFWQYYLGNSTAFTQYPLWIANYGVRSPWVPGGWKKWTFWQKTSTATVNGIAGNVDLNVFNGTSAQLATLAQASGTSDGGGVPTGPTTPTKAASVTTMTASRTSAYPNQQVTFSGTLRSATGKRLPNRTVRLLRKAAGTTTYTEAASTTTDASGAFALDARVVGAATYLAAFRGGRLYARSRSAAATMTVLPRVATSVDIRSLQSAVKAGTTVTFYGHFRRTDGTGIAGRRIRMWERLGGSSAWTLVASGSSVAPTGWWQAAWVPKKGASYRATWRGGLVYKPAASTPLSVPVS